jgi:hypothetical protein
MIFVIQYKRVVSRTSWVLGGARDLGLARGECGSISSPLLASLFRVADVLAGGVGWWMTITHGYWCLVVRAP